MLQIPLRQEVDWRQRITLDGDEYFLRLVYRTRSRCWYMTLSDRARVPILSGRRVVVGYQLLYRVADARRPPGDIYCFDRNVSGGASEWDLEQLGQDVRLYYMTRAEIEALKEAPDTLQAVEIS